MTWPGKNTTTGRGRHVILGQTLVPEQATWEHVGDNGEPDIFARFEVRDGRPECIEMRIMAKPNGRGLRTSDLGIWQLDNFVVNVFDRLGEPITISPSGMGTARQPQSDAEQWAVRKDVTDARTTRRGGPSREELERVAAAYRKHFESGAPVQAVAALFGLSSRTAARRVQQAREAGLLPKTQRGKARA